jgi:hypothetical protein
LASTPAQPAASGEDDVFAAPRKPAVARAPRSQTIQLASSLVADLPADSGDWRWARASGVTFVVHRDASGQASSVLYAEDMSVGGLEQLSTPSISLRRFLATVDPTLVGEGWSLEKVFGAVALQLVTGDPLDPEAWDDVAALATGSLSSGLGFRGVTDGFSGWRWMGDNGHGVMTRMSRIAGRWGGGSEAARQRLDDLKAWMPQDAALASAVGPLVEQLDKALGTAGPREVPESPATAWVAVFEAGSPTGGLATPSGLGAYVAIVCRTGSVCEDEAAWAALIRSVRGPSRGDNVSTAEPSVSKLAGEVGLKLIDSALVEQGKKAIVDWVAALKEQAGQPPTGAATEAAGAGAVAPGEAEFGVAE